MADLLVVTSKIKKTIRAKAGMNTSGDAITVMSNVIDEICDAAIKRAQEDGRKTVMVRDIVIPQTQPQATPNG